MVISLSCSLFGQTNYRVSYDKLTDQVTYFKLNWVNGELDETPVKSVRLQQNDIVHIELNNVNPFTFATEVYTGTTELSNSSSSPIGTILAGFSGFGGPAFGILTSLAKNPPSPVYATRGEQDPIQIQRQEMSLSVQNIYQDMTDMLNMYQSYQQIIGVKFSKSLTQEQIISQLDSLNQVLDFSGLEEKYAEIIEEHEKLAALQQTTELPEEDQVLKDIQFIENKLSVFQEKYLDEEGNLQIVDLSSDLFETQVAEFTLMHTFSAKGVSNYGDLFASNEFFIVFSEIKGDEPELYPIDFVKKISIPVQQPKAPYWMLSVQSVHPIGGINNYNVQVVYEDYFSGDSLSILQTSQNGGLLTFGTLLAYDFDKDHLLIPSIVAGAGIAGINQAQENWRLSLSLGGGLTFRNFPFLSINAGIGLTQTKMLKNQYYVNRTFLAPEGADAYNNYESLFTNKMKPSFFFGLGIRL